MPKKPVTVDGASAEALVISQPSPLKLPPRLKLPPPRRLLARDSTARQSALLFNKTHLCKISLYGFEDANVVDDGCTNKISLNHHLSKTAS
jgi:hypothetical protein